MMLSSCQILFAYVCEPHTLTRQYLSFLLTHGGIRTLEPKRPKEYLGLIGSVINSAAECKTTRFIAHDPNLFMGDLVDPKMPVKLLSEFQSKIMTVPHDHVLCAVQHPYTTECSASLINAFKGEWWRALSLYLPLNAVPFYLT